VARFRDLAEGATCILARAGMLSHGGQRLLAPPTMPTTASLIVHSTVLPSSCGMAASPILPICVSGDAQREEPKHGAHTRPCTFIAYRDDYKGWEFLDHETGSSVVSLAGETASDQAN
jgi:hypothetical protein